MCVIDINAPMILYARGLCVQVGVICVYILFKHLSNYDFVCLCLSVFMILWIFVWEIREGEY